MRLQILLLGSVSGAAYLLWTGYHSLRDLGSGYAHTPASLGPDHLGPVLFGIGLLSVACLLLSGRLPLGSARVLALLPLALIGVGQAYLELTAKRNAVAYGEGRAAAQASREDRLSHIPRDFILLPAESARPLPFRDSFLTLDPRRQLLFRIDVGHEAGLTAVCLGRIDGDGFDIFETEDDLTTAFYSQYRDARGQTLFQRYAVRYGTRPDPQGCLFQWED